MSLSENIQALELLLKFAEDMEIIEIPTKLSEFINDKGFIDKSVNDLKNYTLSKDTASALSLRIDNSTYLMTVGLVNKNGTTIDSKTIDLPLETMVVSGSYDSENKKVILTLKNGETVEFEITDLVNGLVSETYLTELLKDYAKVDEIPEAPIQAITVDGVEQTPDENGVVNLALGIPEGVATESYVDEKIGEIGEVLDSINADLSAI